MKNVRMTPERRSLMLKNASFSHVFGWGIVLAVLNFISILVAFYFLREALEYSNASAFAKVLLYLLVIVMPALWIFFAIGAGLMRNNTNEQHFLTGAKMLKAPFLVYALLIWILTAFFFIVATVFAIEIAVSTDSLSELFHNSGASDDLFISAVIWLISPIAVLLGLFYFNFFRAIKTISNYACNRDYKPYNPHAKLIMVVSIGVYVVAVIAACVLMIVESDYSPVFWGVLLGGIPTMMVFVSLSRFFEKVAKTEPIIQKQRKE